MKKNSKDEIKGVKMCILNEYIPMVVIDGHLV